MNRLTKRGKHGTVFAIINGNTVQRIVFQRREYPDKVIWDKYDIGSVYDRLAQYEELGYEPDEIKEIIAQRDRLKQKYEDADPPEPEEEQRGEAEETTGVRLYTKYEEQKDGTKIPVGYAYGEPWVAQALAMDDLRFETPESAVAWWENEGKWRQKK